MQIFNFQYVRHDHFVNAVFRGFRSFANRGELLVSFLESQRWKLGEIDNFRARPVDSNST